MTNEYIQLLAKELSKLDRECDFERIRKIEAEICAHELGLLKNVGGKAYFPLLDGLNGCLPFEDFYDIFIDALFSVLRNYDPDRGKFMTAIMFLVRDRMKDYFGRNKKKYEQEVSYEQRLEILGEAGDISDGGDFTDKFVRPQSEFEAFCRIAPLVALRKMKERHLSKSKRNYFEGFFTFDVTAQTKKGVFDGDEVIEEDELLFPIMEMVVLGYLLFGTFVHMRDVVNGMVKNRQGFEQRNKTMRVCYDITKPTVVERNKRYYRQLWEAVNE